MRRLPLRSPPHVRGKGPDLYRVRRCPGITPAYAGKSEKQVPFLPPYQDHPRVCGEKVALLRIKPLTRGSPPRMRGKGYNTLGAIQQGRITPAYAGKRACFARLRLSVWDHPRVCGEKLSCPERGRRRMGSPPRMQGKGGTIQPGRKRLGITPRVCGEKRTGI